MKTETEKYARQCDVTGEGMNEGYCIQDGLMYIKHEKDLLKHLREIEKEGNPEYDTLVAEGRLTDVLLLDEYYDAEYYLWTEWYDDIEYAENMAIIESNKLKENLIRYYEVDLDNCQMTHELWIEQLAKCMLNSEDYIKEFIKQLKDYEDERQ